MGRQWVAHFLQKANPTLIAVAADVRPAIEAAGVFLRCPERFGGGGSLGSHDHSRCSELAEVKKGPHFSLSLVDHGGG